SLLPVLRSLPQGRARAEVDDRRRAVSQEGRHARPGHDRRRRDCHAAGPGTPMRILSQVDGRRRRGVFGGLVLASLLSASTLAAQGGNPPAGGAGRGGRGGGRGTAIPAGESCPPGTTEIRPRSCMAPEFAPPSILDYRPKSTLIVLAHMVPTAKYPAIDFHGHPGQLIASAQGLGSLKASLDSLNVRMMISADNLSGDRLKSMLAAVASSPMKDRVRILAGINFRNVGPEWAAGAIKQLDADIAAGAVGVGEISKSLGLSIRKPDGSRLRIDDPELDPIWDECARLGIPVFIHTADPQEFFKTIDYTNERWLELSLFGDRR